MPATNLLPLSRTQLWTLSDRSSSDCSWQQFLVSLEHRERLSNMFPIISPLTFLEDSLRWSCPWRLPSTPGRMVSQEAGDQLDYVKKRRKRKSRHCLLTRWTSSPTLSDILLPTRKIVLFPRTLPVKRAQPSQFCFDLVLHFGICVIWDDDWKETFYKLALWGG